MRTSDCPSPVPLAVLVSRASIWKRGQNGLKFQNISGEVSLETVLCFRQVRGQSWPLSSGAAHGPALEAQLPDGEPCSYHRKHGMSRVRGRASEASEIRTLFDQAPKYQFFFL